jgi:hypothetical protein
LSSPAFADLVFRSPDEPLALLRACFGAKARELEQAARDHDHDGEVRVAAARYARARVAVSATVREVEQPGSEHSPHVAWFLGPPPWFADADEARERVAWARVELRLAEGELRRAIAMAPPRPRPATAEEEEARRAALARIPELVRNETRMEIARRRMRAEKEERRRKAEADPEGARLDDLRERAGRIRPGELDADGSPLTLNANNNLFIAARIWFPELPEAVAARRIGTAILNYHRGEPLVFPRAERRGRLKGARTIPKDRFPAHYVAAYLAVVEDITQRTPEKRLTREAVAEALFPPVGPKAMRRWLKEDGLPFPPPPELVERHRGEAKLVERQRQEAELLAFYVLSDERSKGTH